ncbi:MAG: SRPBCC family protein [Planctomycetes bacterium]|nr:SRPBCC family protein [Planctomycetota bacterium]
MKNGSGTVLRPPIRVRVVRELRRTPAQVGEALLQLENWPAFRGYGPLPGIRAARFRVRTEGVVGTQIAVTNRDGSSHVEEITEWLNPNAIVLRLSEFTAPLCFLATHFIERWVFVPAPAGCRAERSFELYPRTWWGGVLLRLIAPLLRRAAERHLSDLERAPSPG